MEIQPRWFFFFSSYFQGQFANEAGLLGTPGLSSFKVVYKKQTGTETLSNIVEDIFGPSNGMEKINTFMK